MTDIPMVKIDESTFEKLRASEVELFRTLDKLPPDEAICVLIAGIEARANDIRFSLIEQYNDERIKAMALDTETDPLACIDMYIDSIIRKCLWLKHVAPYRATEIRKMRKEYKTK